MNSNLKDIKLTKREKKFLAEEDEEKAYEMIARKGASVIRQEVLIEKFKELKDEKWIYWAGKDWKGLPINTLIEKFKELKDENWIYHAGEDWGKLTANVLIEKFKELKNEYWIYLTGKVWKGLFPDVLIEKFKELKDEYWICETGKDWKGLTDNARYEKIISMLENAEMTKKFMNGICNEYFGWYKSDISLELKLLLDALKNNVFNLEQEYTRKKIEMLLLGYHSNKNDKDNWSFDFE